VQIGGPRRSRLVRLLTPRPSLGSCRIPVHVLVTYQPPTNRLILGGTVCVFQQLWHDGFGRRHPHLPALRARAVDLHVHGGAGACLYAFIG
jgi:hypothetical protein